MQDEEAKHNNQWGFKTRNTSSRANNKVQGDNTIMQDEADTTRVEVAASKTRIGEERKDRRCKMMKKQNINANTTINQVSKHTTQAHVQNNKVQGDNAIMRDEADATRVEVAASKRELASAKIGGAK